LAFDSGDGGHGMVVVIQLLLGQDDGARYSAGSSDITQEHDGGSGKGAGNRVIRYGCYWR